MRKVQLQFSSKLFDAVVHLWNDLKQYICKEQVEEAEHFRQKNNHHTEEKEREEKKEEEDQQALLPLIQAVQEYHQHIVHTQQVIQQFNASSKQPQSSFLPLDLFAAEDNVTASASLSHPSSFNPHEPFLTSAADGDDEMRASLPDFTPASVKVRENSLGLSPILSQMKLSATSTSHNQIQDDHAGNEANSQNDNNNQARDSQLHHQQQQQQQHHYHQQPLTSSSLELFLQHVGKALQGEFIHSFIYNLLIYLFFFHVDHSCQI
jgi:hypothetical protein